MEPGESTGTIVTFYASDVIFETTTYSYETLASRFREMAFLNKGLKITIVDERTRESEGDADAEAEDASARQQTFQYADGLIDYVKYLTGNKETIHPTVIAIDANAEEQHMSLEVAMQWNISFNESVHTFANTINTHEGGTHEEGFRASLTNTVNKWGETWGMIKKKEDRVSGDDIREGLTAIISVKLAEPQFEGQTKTKLGNTEARSFVQKVVNDLLGDWFEKNPADGKDIVRKSQSAAIARMAARKARDMARSRKGLLNKGQYGKLSDCSSTEPSECEVFIVEGDSAGGSAKGGRDPRTQAILPIRGKILNVEKARLDRILQNREVEAIFNTLGTGVPGGLRRRQAALPQDRADGRRRRRRRPHPHAAADAAVPVHEAADQRWLHLPRAAAAVPAAVEQRIRTSWPTPTRSATGCGTTGVAAGKKLPNVNPIQRYKGLGEMDAGDLWDTTMDPAKRALLQVTLDDAAAADEMFSILMGEDVEQRRSFIQRNAKDVRFLDI